MVRVIPIVTMPTPVLLISSFHMRYPHSRRNPPTPFRPISRPRRRSRETPQKTSEHKSPRQPTRYTRNHQIKSRAHRIPIHANRRWWTLDSAVLQFRRRWNNAVGVYSYTGTHTGQPVHSGEWGETFEWGYAFYWQLWEVGFSG